MACLQHINDKDYNYFEIPEEKAIVCGREDYCDFQILESGISKEHFGIEQNKQNELFLSDIGSTNGTFLNGKRLAKYKAYKLKYGDMIRAGEQDFLLRETVPVKVKTICKHCGSPLTTDDERKVGQKISCPVCGESVMIPIPVLPEK